MLKNFFSNFYTKITIYLLCIFILFLLFKEQISLDLDLHNKEDFTNKNPRRKKRTIYSIIPSAVEDNLFFGTFISKSKNKKKRRCKQFCIHAFS